MNREKAEAIDRLRQAYNDHNLTLYLGAGVSVGNGIPTWEVLVLAMYFAAIDEQPMGRWRPYPNYLFAIAEWHLGRSREPLDVIARKIRKYHRNQESFLESLRQTLYAGFNDPFGDEFQRLEPGLVREANLTLDSVANLCESDDGVRSVITYNYDGLLEVALIDRPFQSFWKTQPLEPDRLPIYHVHGYVAVDPESGSTAEDIIFTEEQYHLAAEDSYSWANLVQLQAMSTSLGLMVGLSLSDRNMRRLLDAVNRAPVISKNFVLMKRPRWRRPSDEELDQIHDNAQRYMERFERSGSKRPGIKGFDWRRQIRGILEEVEQLDSDQQTFVLSQLGVRPIWYEDHREVPEIIASIRG
jgi:hypothetical protein